MNRSLAYDAAVVLVPHDLHVEFAKKCVNGGKHVLLEKPVANTLSGCLDLIELADSTSKVLMIGENSRFWPEVWSVIILPVAQSSCMYVCMCVLVLF